MAAEVRINFVIGGAETVQRMLSSIVKATDAMTRANVRTQRNAARETVRVADDAARQRVAAEAAAQRQIDRLALATHRHTLTMARDRAREETRLAAEAVRREAAVLAERKRSLRGAVGGVVSGAGGFVRTLGRGVNAGVSLGRDLASGHGIEFGLGRAIRGKMDIEKRAVDLSNAAYQEQGIGIQRPRVDPKMLMQEASRVAQQTATDPTKALEGLQGFVGITGDLETGRALLGDLAKLSRATGSNLDDVVKTAGEFSKSMGEAATNSEEAKRRAAAVYTLMKGVAGQGKLGSVEMKDMAQHGARFAAAATQFEGNAGDNILKVGMLAQEARGGGGAWNAATAAGSVSGLVTTLKTDARRQAFRAAGVEIEGEGGKLRDPTKIITDAIDKTGGNIDKLTPLFKNVVGSRAMQGLANIYMDKSGGRQDAESKAKGRAAVEAEINRMTSKATMSDSEVNESFARSMQTAEAKAQLFQQRVDQIAGDLADKILPAFINMLPVIESQLVPALKKFVEDVSQHGPKLVDALAKIAPVAAVAADKLAGLIGVMANNPELTAALYLLVQVGPSLMTAATSLQASSAGNMAAAGSLARAAGVLGAAAAGFLVGKEVGDDMAKGNKRHIAETDVNTATATNLASKIRTGTASEEEIAQAKTLQGRLDERANTGIFGRFAEGAGAGYKGLTSGDVTLANVASVLPFIAAIRGGTEAVYGGSDQKQAGDAAKELRDALSQVEVKPGSKVGIDNAEAISGPIVSAIQGLASSGALQGPKAQTE